MVKVAANEAMVALRLLLKKTAGSLVSPACSAPAGKEWACYCSIWQYVSCNPLLSRWRQAFPLTLQQNAARHSRSSAEAQQENSRSTAQQEHSLYRWLTPVCIQHSTAQRSRSQPQLSTAQPCAAQGMNSIARHSTGQIRSAIVQLATARSTWGAVFH